MPDGLGDFVKALNNPKEYLTREKRSKQLEEKLGIDTNEIVEVPAEMANNNNSNNNQNELSVKKKLTTAASSANLEAQTATNVPAKKEETPIEKITRDELRKMKGFQKLLKKQHKEKETLKKKHNKEKSLMQKNHSAAIDKLTTIYNKQQQQQQQLIVNNNINNEFVNNQNNSTRSSRSSKRSNQENNNNECKNDKDKIADLVDEQTRTWVALVERQTQEEKQLNNEHIDQQCSIFEQLLVEAQKQRVKFIEQKQNK